MQRADSAVQIIRDVDVDELENNNAESRHN
jgi:hypothetical protein